MPLSRINVGCGDTPTPGWINFDNSPSIVIGRVPGLTRALGALGALGALDASRFDFSRVAGEGQIRWANAWRLPVPDASADVVYSSHMIEHMGRAEALRFLGEARRVLAPGGILRLGVPDLAMLVAQYRTDGDADQFVSRTLLAQGSARTLEERLRFLLVGNRGHAWMYDGASLMRLVTESGFVEAAPKAPGQTTISDPGPLDLYQRADETAFVEARRPPHRG
jgi:SAM-dependent methyltransferase